MSATDSPLGRYAVALSKERLQQQLAVDQQNGQLTTLLLESDDESLVVSFRAVSTLHENDRDIVTAVSDQNKNLNIHLLHSGEVFILLIN